MIPPMALSGPGSISIGQTADANVENATQTFEALLADLEGEHAETSSEDPNPNSTEETPVGTPDSDASQVDDLPLADQARPVTDTRSNEPAGFGSATLIKEPVSSNLTPEQKSPQFYEEHSTQSQAETQIEPSDVKPDMQLSQDHDAAAFLPITTFDDRNTPLPAEQQSHSQTKNRQSEALVLSDPSQNTPSNIEDLELKADDTPVLRPVIVDKSVDVNPQGKHDRPLQESDRGIEQQVGVPHTVSAQMSEHAELGKDTTTPNPSVETQVTGGRTENRYAMPSETPKPVILPQASPGAQIEASGKITVNDAELVTTQDVRNSEPARTGRTIIPSPHIAKAPEILAPPPILVNAEQAPAPVDALVASRTAPNDPTTTSIHTLPTEAASQSSRAIAVQIAQNTPLGGQQSVEISLSPEELGRVRLSLSSGEGSITLTLAAERSETLDLLRRHSEELAQEFRALGYDDLEFIFQHGSDDRGADQSDANGAASTQVDEDDLPPSNPTVETYLPTGLDIRI